MKQWIAVVIVMLSGAVAVAQSTVTGVILPFANGQASATYGQITNRVTIDNQGNFAISVPSNINVLMAFTPLPGSPYAPFSLSVYAGPGVTNITQQLQPYITPAIGSYIGLLNQSAVATNAQGYAIPGTNGGGGLSGQTPNSFPLATSPTASTISSLLSQSADGNSLIFSPNSSGCFSFSPGQICITAPPYNASSSGLTTTQTAGTFGVGTSGQVASCSTFRANQGVLITGAGAAAANYIGKVVSCSGTTLTVNPATSTSVGNGTLVQHDETAAFQAAFTAIGALAIPQGAIYVPDGTYLVNGPLQDTGGANAVLVVPAVINYSGQPVHISIIGFTEPPLAQLATPSGAVIKTSLPVGNLIAGYKTGGVLPPFTNVNLILTNVSFRSYDNPCLVVINATNILALEMTNVRIDGSGSTVTPSCTTGAGVLYPAGGNEVQLTATNLAVAGYYRGVVAGEHTHIGTLYMANDVFGLVLDSQSPQGNAISVDYLWCQLCTNLIAAGSSDTEVNIQVADSEVTTANMIYDPSNHLRGLINYNIPYDDVRSPSTRTTPANNGGANLQLTNLQFPAISAGPQGPVTVQQVFSGAATMNYAHNLGTTDPLYSCLITAGTPTYTVAPVDTNNIALTTSAAGTISCAFRYSPSAVSQHSLKGFWKLNEGTGTNAADSSPSANNFTLASGSWTTQAGLSAGAYAFNGTTTHGTTSALTGVNFDFNQPFSVMAWVNSSDNVLTHAVIGHLDTANNFRGWELSMNRTTAGGGNFTVDFFLINSYGSNALDVVSTTDITTNALHQLVVSYDGTHTASGVKIYLDSVLQTNAINENDLSATTTNAVNLQMGTRMDGSIPFVGNLGPQAIWNRVITQSEVNSLFANPYLTIP